MIVLPKNLDISSIKLGEPQKNKMGGNVVYLQYQNAKRLTIQTPWLSTPFGVSCYVDESNGNKKYSLDLSFKGMEDDPKIMAFKNKMAELDEYLLDTCTKNSYEWLGKKQKKEVVEALYRPLVKPSKDPEKYAPTMKLKILTNKSDDSFNVEAFKHKTKQPMDFSKLKKGSQVSCIIEVGSVWFVGKTNFGISFRLVQARVKSPDKITGYSFTKDSDDEESDEENDEEENDTEDEEVDELSGDLENTELSD